MTKNDPGAAIAEVIRRQGLNLALMTPFKTFGKMRGDDFLRWLVDNTDVQMGAEPVRAILCPCGRFAGIAEMVVVWKPTLKVLGRFTYEHCQHCGRDVGSHVEVQW